MVEKPTSRREKVQETFANIGGCIGFVCGVVGLVGAFAQGDMPPVSLFKLGFALGLFALAGWVIGWLIGVVVSSMFADAPDNQSLSRPDPPSDTHSVSDPTLLGERAQAYLRDLEEWELRSGITRDDLYSGEITNDPSLGIFLLSRLQVWRSPNDLAGAMFMNGMLVGSRAMRLGHTNVAPDLEQRYSEAHEWIKMEIKAGRGDLQADRYLENIRVEERVIGFARGHLAELECSRDPRAPTFLEMAAALWGDNPAVLATSVFTVGLSAGARAYLENRIAAPRV